MSAVPSWWMQHLAPHLRVILDGNIGPMANAKADRNFMGWSAMPSDPILSAVLDAISRQKERREQEPTCSSFPPRLMDSVDAEHRGLAVGEAVNATGRAPTSRVGPSSPSSGSALFPSRVLRSNICSIGCGCPRECSCNLGSSSRR